MTIRKAVVISNCDLGPSSHDDIDEQGRMWLDTTPDRSNIKLRGMNCTTEQFIDWLLIVELSHDRFDLIRNYDGSLEDIGGSSIDFSVGNILEISFEVYFNALVQVRVESAHRDLDLKLKQMTKTLGIELNKSNNVL